MVLGVIIEQCGNHLHCTFLLDDGSTVDRTFSLEEVMKPHPEEVAALN